MKKKDYLCLTQLSPNKYVRVLLMLAGTFFVVIGMIGVVLPILPTTPFLLLAAACYSKSSKRCHDWLLTNRVFGNYIRNYLEGNGIPMRVKIYTIAFLWVIISISAFFFVEIFWVRILLFVIATGVTIHILTLKTLKR
ncbi:MAG: YbaN family protein [Thermoplasmata archaeon]